MTFDSQVSSNVEAGSSSEEVVDAQAGVSQKRRTRFVLRGLWVVLAGSLLNFIFSNASWFLPFARDFVHWLIHPSVAGGPTLPAEWLGGVAIYVAAEIIGLQIASMILRSTSLRGSRRATVGMALILGPCLLGLIAVLAEVTGLLYGWLLCIVLLVVLIVTTIVWRRVGNSGDLAVLRASEDARKDHWAEVAVWSVAAAVVALTFIHVAMSPITEWDAIVYHASVGKLWFLGRPNPPLIYGPSVGIEISANYPPLFPATGAFFYVALNHFDDFYLRILPPLTLLGTLLLSYAYASVRYCRSTARWTVLLMLGCPLLVMYGAWPTSYIYLTALTTAGIILIDFAVESAGLKLWLYAGLVTGLACLTHFFGLIVVAIGIISFFVFGRWRSRSDLKCMAVYLGSTLVVVGPWYLRNTLLLGDPLYPLLSPPAHAKGLIQPIWDDSQAEIRNNAIGQWTASRHIGLGLRFQELLTALFNRNLVPSGVLLVLLVGVWLSRRGERRAFFLTVCVVLLIGVQLVPGWYWWRDLVPAMPIAAILGARAITLLRQSSISAAMHTSERRWSLRRVKVGSFLVGSLAVVASVAGMSVAVIGPDNPTWATGLGSSLNLMQGVENLGSTKATLNYVFQGGYQSWSWLNEHLRANGRVATLDVRNYYFTRPSELFYLDGIEAVPLLKLHDASSIVSFLRSQGVKYIYSPSWAVQSGSAQQPLVHQLSIVHLLGSTSFPLVADFAWRHEPTRCHLQGWRPRALKIPDIPPALYLGPRGGAPQVPLSSDVYEIRADDTTPRL